MSAHADHDVVAWFRHELRDGTTGTFPHLSHSDNELARRVRRCDDLAVLYGNPTAHPLV
jgi:hypothetical protein